MRDKSFHQGTIRVEYFHISISGAGQVIHITRRFQPGIGYIKLSPYILNIERAEISRYARIDKGFRVDISKSLIEYIDPPSFEISRIQEIARSVISKGNPFIY